MNRRDFLKALTAGAVVAVIAPLLPPVPAEPVWAAPAGELSGIRFTFKEPYPTSIRFKVGEDTLFHESYRYRRFLMFEHYGFDQPEGVIIYPSEDLAPVLEKGQWIIG